MGVAAGCQGLPLHLFGRQIYTRIELADQEPQILAKNSPCPLPALSLPSKSFAPHTTANWPNCIMGWRKTIQITYSYRQQHFIQFVCCTQNEAIES